MSPASPTSVAPGPGGVMLPLGRDTSVTGLPEVNLTREMDPSPPNRIRTPVTLDRLVLASLTRSQMSLWPT